LRALRQHFVEECQKRNIDLHILVGNHDIPYRNTNEINAIRETFSNYDINLYAEPKTINLDGCNILMMPWINHTNLSDCMQSMKETPAQIMFGHLEIKGFDMYRGMPSHEGFEPALFDKFDIVASGHFHRKSHSGNIHYLGAPYEMTWSDYDDPRGFHIFDTKTREFEYVQNHLHIFHKVWYNDEGKSAEEMIDRDFTYLADSYVKVIVQSKTNPYIFDVWMNKLHDAKPIDISVVEDHRNMDTMSDEDIVQNAEDTPTILSKYIQGLETKADKNELERLMRSLYMDAVNMENAEA
jgi:DNA repair exonuclease SbcCD nuclease subunit